MKKAILFPLILIFTFAGCNAKDSQLNQKIDEQSTQIYEQTYQIYELTEKNSALEKENEEYQNRISELEAKLEKSQKLLSDLKMPKFDFSDGTIYETHKIDCDLKFEYNGYDTKILENPGDNENVVYTIQKNDEIKVSQFVTLKETGETFLEAGLLPDLDVVGFIKISRNPYEDGNFEYKETVKVDGKDVKILNFDSSYELINGIELRELPSGKSDAVYKVKYEKNKQIYYQTDAITSDYNWVRVTVDGNTGWVNSDCLSVERGGPVIYTPETVIWWELIGGNEA